MTNGNTPQSSPDPVCIFWAGAFPWTLIGTGLLLLGTDLAARSSWLAGHPLGLISLMVSALGLGYLKGRFVLAPVAGRTLDRLADRAGGGRLKSIISALGLRSLLLVAGMMLLGILVRRSGLWPELRAWVCLAIGFALIWSARVYWQEIIGHAWTRRLGAIALIVWLTLGGLMWWALPPASLLAPGGPHAVGVRDWTIEDEARPEDLSPEPGDRRLLSIRVWYPTDPDRIGEATRAPYLPNAREVYRGIGESLGLPPFLLGAAAAVQTNSWLDAGPLVPGAWPLVLYSGGYRQGHQAHNSELAEELASRGYVVVGVNHPWEQANTLTADGQLLTLADDAVWQVTRRLMESDADSLAPTASELLSQTPAQRAISVSDHMSKLPVHAASAARWREDMQTVFDWIQKPQNELGQFVAALTKDQPMAMFGMSFGGSTAGLFCAFEARCAATVNLDGTQWGDWFGNDFNRPVLYMSQPLETWNDAWFAGAGNDFHRVQINGALHGDFTDGFQSTPMTRMMGVLGPIGGRRSAQILRAYVVDFFDHYLKGAAAEVLDSPATFEEVLYWQGVDRLVE